jgi:hypothetical protein
MRGRIAILDPTIMTYTDDLPIYYQCRPNGQTALPIGFQRLRLGGLDERFMNRLRHVDS